MQGKLKSWNDEKGFGFITCEGEDKDIFIHISAFSRTARRPKKGDSVNFNIAYGQNGKNQAVDANIQGAKKESNYHKITHSDVTKMRRKTMKKASIFILLLVIVGTIFKAFMSSSNVHVNHSPSENMFNPVGTDSDHTKFECTGKIYCSEMTSCEEATFYLNNCPNTRIDGNGDGIPCERQWCQ